MGDAMIQNMEFEKLGDFVCSVLNEDLKKEAFFDYMEQKGKVFFRFIIEGKFIDYEFNEMAEKFETVDNLVVALYKS